MGYNIIEKDITQVKMGVIAHGVNCQRVMGSGVAKAIRAKWPEVYVQYLTRSKGKDMLGTADPIFTNDPNIIIVNCYTQVFYGRGGGKYADEQAVRTSIMKSTEIANVWNLPLYLPRIGCGLGGLNWEQDVLPSVDAASQQYKDVNIYICDLPGEPNESNT